jgi:hypothetical protein
MTQPAHLETPGPLSRKDYSHGRIPISERAKWLYQLGKGYLTFYKTGLKNVWLNYKELRKIRARIGQQSLEDVVKYGLRSGSGRQEDQYKPVLTRQDYQLALRTQRDVRKLAPFALILLVCGEFTPLIILALGSAVVPGTCRIPQQELKDIGADLARLRAYKDRSKTQIPHETKNGTPEISAADPASHWEEEARESMRLGLSRISPDIPVLGFVWYKLVGAPRLRRHCEQLLCDTILIVREGGFTKLPPAEVIAWSFKRGLPQVTDLVKGVKLDIDPQHAKAKLLPAAEAEARRILNVDWTRLKPEHHWRTLLRAPPI